VLNTRIKGKHEIKEKKPPENGNRQIFIPKQKAGAKKNLLFSTRMLSRDGGKKQVLLDTSSIYEMLMVLTHSAFGNKDVGLVQIHFADFLANSQAFDNL